MMRRRFSSRRNFRSGRSKNTPHWLGFDVTADLAAAAPIFTEVPIVDATAYEVNTGLTPSASLTVLVGCVVIVINSAASALESAIGYWGFLCVDQDETVAVADHDLGANSLTDERWLHVGAWAAAANGTPVNIPFRVKQRALLRDKRISFVLSYERAIDGAPAINCNVMGRALLRI